MMALKYSLLFQTEIVDLLIVEMTKESFKMTFKIFVQFLV